MSIIQLLFFATPIKDRADTSSTLLKCIKSFHIYHDLDVDDDMDTEGDFSLGLPQYCNREHYQPHHLHMCLSIEDHDPRIGKDYILHKHTGNIFLYEGVVTEWGGQSGFTMFSNPFNKDGYVSEDCYVISRSSDYLGVPQITADEVNFFIKISNRKNENKFAQ